jgi:hypothetical protein
MTNPVTPDWGNVGESDAQAARLLVDAWLEHIPPCDDHAHGWAITVGKALELRGLIAQTLADTRTAGYLEGAMRGRKDIAALVRDAIAGEGL